METLSVIFWTILGSLAICSLITSYYVYKSVKCLTIKVEDTNHEK